MMLGKANVFDTKMFKAFQRKPNSERLKQKYDALNKDLRQEIRKLDKDIRVIEREELKVIESIKSNARRGQNEVANRVLAKEIVKARKQKARIYRTKAEINSLMLKMREHLANARLTTSVQAASDVMQSVHALARVPELAAIMREFEKTMMKAGLMDEMVRDAIDLVLEDSVDALDDEALVDQTIEAILNPKTAEKSTTKPDSVAQKHEEKAIDKILEDAVKGHADIMHG